MHHEDEDPSVERPASATATDASDEAQPSDADAPDGDGQIGNDDAPRMD
jgi:hypothetical protein